MLKRARCRGASVASLTLVALVACSKKSTGPDDIAVDHVSVTLAISQLVEGQSTTAFATLLSSHGVALTGRNCSWSSSNAAVATASGSAQNASVTAVAEGSATIMATCEGVQTTNPPVLTVNRAVPVSVGVTLTPSTIQVGQSSQASAVIRDASNNLLTGRTCLWSSGNPAVATFGGTGQSTTVTAVSVGAATISATCEGVSTTAPPVLTVTPAAVATVNVSLASSSIYVGQTTTASATLLDAQNNLLTGRACSWNSSAPTVASVAGTTQSAIVTAVGVGSTVLSATCESVGATGAPTLTVTAIPIASVTVSLSGNQVVVGSLLLGSVTATATVRDAQNNILGGRTCMFQTSDPAVAAVASLTPLTGTVTAVGQGNVNISAICEGVSTTNPPALAVLGVVSVTVTPKRDSLRVGWNFKSLHAGEARNDGVFFLTSPIGWTSRDPSIVSVTQPQSEVDPGGHLTGQTLGTTYVVASDQGRRDSAFVQVMDACSVDWPIDIGRTVNETIGAQSCSGNQMTAEFTLNASTALAVTGNAPFTYDFTPMLVRNCCGWYAQGVAPGVFSEYIIAGPGHYRSNIQANPSGPTGNASLTLSSWDLSGCHVIVMASGAQSGFIPFDAACTTGYQPAGTVGTFYSISVDLLPQLATGEQFTITATTTGFEPRIDLVLENLTFVANSVASPGSNTTTLNYTSPVNAYYRMRVSSRNPLATGSVQLTIVGPNVNSPIVAGFGTKGTPPRAVQNPKPPRE